MRLLCDDLDRYLEDSFGMRYPLHPNRLARGKAASNAYDGLFSTGTQFTLGYGSEYGRGYIVSVEIRTLSPVKEEDRKQIEEAAMQYLQTIIPIYLGEREISLQKDGSVYKLVGDFSLGTSSNS
ncbi:MAG: hypothetical protein AB7C91_02735 [Sphaerochaeta sp.]|uniref:hypothetical protein n=1 Tax=Sphaerochaeta sp. TaxID=1972642 RepID=UPI002FCBA8B7